MYVCGREGKNCQTQTGKDLSVTCSKNPSSMFSLEKGLSANIRRPCLTRVKQKIKHKLIKPSNVQCIVLQIGFLLECWHFTNKQTDPIGKI